MKIELSKIKPSPNPIRKTWDEEGIEELKWSLMEEGLVMPIGVHENTGDYIIVWGHRRVEAARRAGWKDIEAILVTKDEINNLIQAGIENLSSKNMTADDKADWAFRLVSLGLSDREISRRSSIAETTISSWLIYKRNKEAGVNIDVHHADIRDEGVSKTIVLEHVLGNDLEGKKIVASKASKDNLSKEQTREVAHAYRDAPSPQVRNAVLQVRVEKKDTAADIMKKADTIYSAKAKIPSLMAAPLVVSGYRDWQELGVSINYLKHVNQDTATAILILKQWIGYCEQRLAEMKEITEPSND